MNLGIGEVAVVAFDVVALLASFLSLCVVCDEHLVPCVEVFIVQFQMPEEVAAVTLVAFGSAAPELFLNSVSAVAQTSDLSLAAILGSGIIAFGLIPPLILLSSAKSRAQAQIEDQVAQAQAVVGWAAGAVDGAQGNYLQGFFRGSQEDISGVSEYAGLLGDYVEDVESLGADIGTAGMGANDDGVVDGGWD
ncbi:hypothetical protein B484DRAFT_388986, partial [Ochromonadaceae sp. CCMP2298]